MLSDNFNGATVLVIMTVAIKTLVVTVDND